MINTLVVTLGNVGEKLVESSSRIMGRPEKVSCFEVAWEADLEKVCGDLERKVQELDTGEGVLILTDIIGGTSHNVSLAISRSNRVEVVTGVNLPMLMKAMSLPSGLSLQEAARSLCKQTRKTIVVASGKGDAA